MYSKLEFCISISCFVLELKFIGCIQVEIGLLDPVPMKGKLRIMRRAVVWNTKSEVTLASKETDSGCFFAPQHENMLFVVTPFPV